MRFLAHDPKTGKPKVYEADDSVASPKKAVRARVMTVGVQGYHPTDEDVPFAGWVYAEPQTAPTIFEETVPTGLFDQPKAKAKKATPQE